MLELNNREFAALIYISLILTAVLLSRQTRPHALDVVRTFFAPKLALIWQFMSLYVMGCVWLLARLNLWEWSNLKTTLLWWITIGFTCGSEAQRFKKNEQKLCRSVRDTFAISAIILFVAELVSFPLWIELLMYPVLALLALLVVASEHSVDKPGNSQLQNLLVRVQTLVGLIILGFSYWLVVRSVDEFWSLNTLREFGITILLWAMFIPFIFLLSACMTYEEVFTRLESRPKQSSVAGYARWRALFAFGWNIEAVNRLARDMRVRDISDKQGVNEAVREIKRLLKTEKNPPVVTPEEGWSPQAARLFLEEYGMVTDDYHRTQWEWFAHTPAVKISDKVLAARISYYLAGNAHAVTRLRLALSGSTHNDKQEGQHAFDERALTLLTKAFDAEQASSLYARAQASEPEAIVIDGVRVWLSQSDWGDSRSGGYDRNVVIEHPTHQGRTSIYPRIRGSH